MITRVEIDGFKTFQDFKIDLAPLQVIVGPNGAGKSNFFDALSLLSNLAGDADLRAVFQKLRGDPSELFTLLPAGERSERMKLAVEILVEPRVEDSWGAVAEIKYTRLRYEIEIARRIDAQGLDRLYVEREMLVPIPRGNDNWIKRFGAANVEHRFPKLTGGHAPFISTAEEHGIQTVYIHQDGHGGRRTSVAARMERTALSGVANTEFPHAFAARAELRAWRFLQLNPAVLREPSSIVGPQRMDTDGRNLASALARMQAEDKFLLNDVSLDLANLVPGIIQVDVEMDRARDQYIIWVKMQDGRRFSSRVLSDGTLRLLALVSLKNDPLYRGVLCFEEPENGIHPYRLKNVVQLLCELATDFDDLQQEGLPLRQILCNTHSPLFIGQPSILPFVLFAHTTLRINPGQPDWQERITRLVPVTGTYRQLALLDISHEELAYTISEVQAYLESTDLGEMHHLLQNSGIIGFNGK